MLESSQVDVMTWKGSVLAKRLMYAFIPLFSPLRFWEFVWVEHYDWKYSEESLKDWILLASCMLIPFGDNILEKIVIWEMTWGARAFGGREIIYELLGYNIWHICKNLKSKLIWILICLRWFGFVNDPIHPLEIISEYHAYLEFYMVIFYPKCLFGILSIRP